MKLALQEAKRFEGATAPNPPVGAVALDEEGHVLATGAHECAGGLHAEVVVLQKLKSQQLLHRVQTLVVTLEPCNHEGKTPPCTEAIVQTPVKRVVIGVQDPNPKVQGRGVARLRQAGIEVIEGVLQKECAELIRSFQHWVETGFPWIVIKKAVNLEGLMIPPCGQKTFTQVHSLQFAHQLRRRADAILTGSGTVLADQPEFTVRLVNDHQNLKKRWLIVMDRRGRCPLNWLQAREAAGFQVRIEQDLQLAFEFLGRQGSLEVLVEAGPALLESIYKKNLWNQEFIISQSAAEGEKDGIQERLNYRLKQERH